MKWRRRPYEVEAMLYTGDNLEEVNKFVSPYEVAPHELMPDMYMISFNNRPCDLLIKGWVVAKDRDRITVWDKQKFLSEYERVQ